MRAAFIRSLMEQAKADRRIYLLVGDVGYSLVEPFASEFPERFLNVGIAEQNMIGIATGLALSGKVVFAYSLANFPTMRCVEQIRNDACYHKANVKIVCSGGGLGYGALGASHHVTEDLGVMRVLPNMTIIAPGDPVEAGLATTAVANWPGPCYLRLAKTGDPLVHQSIPEFHIGKAITVRSGGDITFIATGGILPGAVQAAGELDKKGIRARVLSMHTVKPLDTEAVLKAKEETKAILTIEEHNVLGGLGGAVAEVLAETSGQAVAFERMGLKDCFCSQVGSQEYLRKIHGLSVQDIVGEAIKLLGGS